MKRLQGQVKVKEILALRQIDLELRLTALDNVYDVDCEKEEVEK